MKKVAIIGGGISGLSIAHLLKKYDVKVFEKDSKPGGLIKCDIVKGNLYHKVGGHVFNSRRQDVLEWFWKFFNRETEFIKATRNAVVSIPNTPICPYPIENHIYIYEKELQMNIIKDIFSIAEQKNKNEKPNNFEEFLTSRFGKTLYEIYFKPYNTKIWKQDLRNIPLSWLEGKLPMPTPEEIIFNNFNHVKEMNMVHSSFYYPKSNGSQLIADRLAENIRIEYNSNIDLIKKEGSCWNVKGENFDFIVFCGNIKDLPQMLSDVDISYYHSEIELLDYHGTTSVLCEIQNTDYSWIYLPDPSYDPHRIICTGNFAYSNNASKDVKTATLEFTDYIEKDEILKQIKNIPFSLNYITHEYTKYTYPIQSPDTRHIISSLKDKLSSENLFLLGRFAEWEYYNMDAAIAAAIDLSEKINF
jgi:protoporphyrinogen oxidase